MECTGSPRHVHSRGSMSPVPHNSVVMVGRNVKQEGWEGHCLTLVLTAVACVVASSSLFDILWTAGAACEEWAPMHS